MNKIKISAIIPTYNRSDLLLNTIKSLKEQSYIGYEIIVVDNGCSDHIRLLVESQKKDIDIKKCSIRYIQSPDIGLHNTRHIGAKSAKGEILLYIDDDIIADKNLLQEIIKPYHEADIGCVGGRILPDWEVEPPEWINQIPKWYLSILDDDEGPKEVQWIYGCNFSVRKELLFRVGGFNPDAFGNKKLWWYRGDGEIGLLKKVHEAGEKVIYNPNALVWHLIPKERLTVGYIKERAFKTGIEDSFSRYYYNNTKSFKKIKLLSNSAISGVKYIFHTNLAFLHPREKIKKIIKASYYKSRFLYDLRLAIDKNLHEFIKKKNWLE
jgi:glycosyltransferase involved in cell wall biosynthesis